MPVFCRRLAWGQRRSRPGTFQAGQRPPITFLKHNYKSDMQRSVNYRRGVKVLLSRYSHAVYEKQSPTHCMVLAVRGL
jgi:hypothetical protein